jgi:hypothetical protein
MFAKSRDILLTEQRTEVLFYLELQRNQNTQCEGTQSVSDQLYSWKVALSVYVCVRGLTRSGFAISRRG